MKIWLTLHAAVLVLAAFACPNVSGQDATNYRVWTSQDGKVRIRAKFLRFIDGKAQMAREEEAYAKSLFAADDADDDDADGGDEGDTVEEVEQFDE